MKLAVKVVQISPVFHVGTFNVADKGVRGSSYEGKGLSVSTEPDAWITIAKLGGLPTHKLRKQGSAFLDFHALTSDKNNKQALYSWGKKSGHLTTGRAWRFSHFDDEWERTFVSYTANQGEADEAKEDGDDVSLIKNFPFPTDAALVKAGIGQNDRLTSVNDVLALLLAEAHGLDGVWWDDDLDESRLSAPRGVIFPDKLPTWTVTRSRS